MLKSDINKIIIRILVFVASTHLPLVDCYCNFTRIDDLLSSLSFLKSPSGILNILSSLKLFQLGLKRVLYDSSPRFLCLKLS